MNQPRIFIAIPLSLSNKEVIQDAVEKHKSLFSKQPLCWVKRENYHVTLEFLGPIEPEIIPIINKELSLITSTCKPFSIDLGNLLCFPNFKNVKVVTFSVKLNEILATLYNRIHQTLLALNLKLDQRPYLPHITIARAEQLTLDPSTMPKIKMLHSWEVSEIALFESVKCEEQSNYIIRSTFEFNTF